MKQLYRLRHRIGEGGMGVVYAADKVGAEPLPVAIKLMRTNRTDLSDEQLALVAEMFQRESVCSWRVNHDHPGLVTVYDFGTMDDGVPYLVMEFVDGVHLAELHRDAEPDYPLIRRIAHDMLEALGHLHDQELLHRDVSPKNILLARNGAIKLADLGLVKELQDDISGLIHGTCAYSSPEALQGLRRTPCSDLYSLGAVLYQLMSGAHPYGDGQPDDVLAAMYDDEYQRPSLADDVPDDLAELVDRLTRFSPGERYQSAAEALAVLQSPLASRKEVAAVVARSPQPTPDTSDLPELDWPFRDRKPGRVTRLTGLFVALFLAAGLLGLGYGWGNRDTGSDVTNPPIATPGEDTAPETRADTPNGIAEERAIDPDLPPGSTTTATALDTPDPRASDRTRTPGQRDRSESSRPSHGATDHQSDSPRFFFSWNE